MRFAHFAHVWRKSGMTPATRYQQLWRELQVADETGFDYGFCVEHHFSPNESWMSAPNLYAVAAAARTRHIRLGAMGHVVPLHHPVRLLEEIAIADQIVDGRLEVGLVPGILPSYFVPFNAEFDTRRELTLEFVSVLKSAYAGAGEFSYSGRYHHLANVVLSVLPVQRPHPPLWLETRDPTTLEFCARVGANSGYFITFPRQQAKERYSKYLADWKAAGWRTTPNIAYSTVVYVAETDHQALDTALHDASIAYRGFFGDPSNPAEFEKNQNEVAELHERKKDPEGAEIIRNLLNPEYLLAKDLILVGSPETVADKLKRWANEGMFNTFFGEFNFGDMAEADVLRSIRLFGERVIPALRDYEPFH